MAWPIRILYFWCICVSQSASSKTFAENGTAKRLSLLRLNLVRYWKEILAISSCLILKHKHLSKPKENFSRWRWIELWIYYVLSISRTFNLFTYLTAPLPLCICLHSFMNAPYFREYDVLMVSLCPKKLTY